MHPTIAQTLTSQHQTALLREAEMHRLAAQGTRARGHRGFLSLALAAATRMVVGEAGVATRHAAGAGVGTVTATVAAEAPTRTADRLAADQPAARAARRPSPSL